MVRKNTKTPGANQDSNDSAQTSVAKRQRPMAQPAFIDGAPVSEDGQFISQPSPARTKQMALAPASEIDDQHDVSGGDAPDGKTWGDPYKAIFVCSEMGFELGENRRFKQRVFRFKDKPAAAMLSVLKEQGFVYRSDEKSWTITANPDTRKLTDELAREWAGPNYRAGIER